MKTDEMGSGEAAEARPTRREILLRVTADLFLRNRYDSVVVEVVCAQADLSGLGLYRHFQNKQGFLIAMVENPLEFVHRFARATAEVECDPRAALEVMVDFHIRSVFGWHDPREVTRKL
ncbi:TetR/AcrR family transcriptional regulator [Rhodococcus baikonurensis]|uniref:TetR/AcrR family transcriptional regulator n=1 Tax=Rhodococcus baikonurensis TaxID=172041 RepID=UPI0037AF6D3F